MGTSVEKANHPPALAAFLRHAAENSPYYRNQPWATKLRDGGQADLSEIPLTPTGAIRDQVPLFCAENVPPSQGSVVTKYTSGSSGTPMEVRKTLRHFQINMMDNQKAFRAWQTQDHAIAAYNYQPTAEKPDGTVALAAGERGQKVVNVFTHSADKLHQVIAAHKPALLSTRPRMATTLLEQPTGLSSLRLIITSTESLPDNFTALLAALPDCRNLDLYGSVETGLLATTCPKCGNYHLAEDTSFVEVLGDDGTPVPEHGLGRVIVTVHSNWAMPLIRYDIGDYVQASYQSPCAPGRLSLMRIHGREIMMFRLPGGELVVPRLNADTVLKLGVARFKMVQTTPNHIEFRYQLRDGAQLSVAAIQALVHQQMSPLLGVTLKPVTEFPLAPSGKYLMHERLFS